MMGQLLREAKIQQQKSLKTYVQNLIRGAELCSPIGTFAVSFLLQFFNSLKQHLVLVCKVIHIRPQEIHFLLQE